MPDVALLPSSKESVLESCGELLALEWMRTRFLGGYHHAARATHALSSRVTTRSSWRSPATQGASRIRAQRVTGRKWVGALFAPDEADAAFSPALQETRAYTMIPRLSGTLAWLKPVHDVAMNRGESVRCSSCDCWAHASMSPAAGHLRGSLR